MVTVNIDDIESHKFDFNVEHYAEILKLAKKKYKFTNYSDRSYEEGQKAYWRHDVDISLNRALRLARIENEHQVSSTFFLNLHCEFYNLFEKSQFEIVKKILSLGHQIGLHLDASFYPIKNAQELDSKLRAETQILESLFDTEIHAFSFHNPDPLMLSFEREEYGGLVNCYAKIFKTSIGYCSDSNGYWRFNRLQDFLESNNYQSVQILTHPEWWQEESIEPRERVFRCVDGRAKRVMNQYDTILAENGRLNIGLPTKK